MPTTRPKTTRMARFINGLPKCELHLHIEGTLEPEMMFTFAERNKVKLKFKTVAQVKKAYNFSNLQDFLDIYYAGASVLQKEEDFYDLAYAYFEKAAKQSVRHAEVFFDPQTHTDRGIPYEVVINGLTGARDDARKNLKLSSSLILCFLRHKTEKDALAALEQALPFSNRIIGIGLDSSEKGHPPEKFKKVYALAREHKLRCVAHAGEEGSAEYVWSALKNLKVERIDHGIHALDDPKLVDHLVKNRIPLTVCPLSNVKLRVFKSMKEHTLKNMLDLGIRATVNSDDPAYFGGYVNENFLAVQEALGLTADELVQLALNSFDASFLSGATRFALKHQVRRYANDFLDRYGLE